MRVVIVLTSSFCLVITDLKDGGWPPEQSKWHQTVCCLGQFKSC